LAAPGVQDTLAAHVSEYAQQHWIDQMALGEIAVRLHRLHRLAGIAVPLPDGGFVCGV
jgi:hypothetical protein